MGELEVLTTLIAEIEQLRDLLIRKDGEIQELLEELEGEI